MSTGQCDCGSEQKTCVLDWLTYDTLFDEKRIRELRRKTKIYFLSTNYSCDPFLSVLVKCL